jgi:hypothetical protein
MRRTIFLLVLALTVMVLGVVPAAADVHRVAQAGCAPAGVASGAIGSRHAIPHGRPVGQIMITASPFDSIADFPGSVNSKAVPQGTNC